MVMPRDYRSIKGMRIANLGSMGLVHLGKEVVQRLGVDKLYGSMMVIY